uniref:Chaperone DnaJ C-terminal domain-containing protein n=1 Tax=Quercus lobata TaxID=97700 RepID=A0A7N2LB67_QUELO
MKCMGVDNDETIKVSRSGGADPDGNQPGDLYIVIKVHSSTQPGQKVVLKKKGWQRSRQRNSYSFGDQYVHFNVSIPSNLTPRQHELIEEFAKEEQGEYDKRATTGESG